MKREGTGLLPFPPHLSAILIGTVSGPSADLGLVHRARGQE